MNRGLSDIGLVGWVEQAEANSRLVDALRERLLEEREQVGVQLERGQRMGYPGRFVVNNAVTVKRLIDELLSIIDGEGVDDERTV